MIVMIIIVTVAWGFVRFLLAVQHAVIQNPTQGTRQGNATQILHYLPD